MVDSTGNRQGSCRIPKEATQVRGRAVGGWSEMKVGGGGLSLSLRRREQGGQRWQTHAQGGLLVLMKRTAGHKC